MIAVARYEGLPLFIPQIGIHDLYRTYEPILIGFFPSSSCSRMTICIFFGISVYMNHVSRSRESFFAIVIRFIMFNDDVISLFYIIVRTINSLCIITGRSCYAILCFDRHILSRIRRGVAHRRSAPEEPAHSERRCDRAGPASTPAIPPRMGCFNKFGTYDVARPRRVSDDFVSYSFVPPYN